LAKGECVFKCRVGDEGQIPTTSMQQKLYDALLSVCRMELTPVLPTKRRETLLRETRLVNSWDPVCISFLGNVIRRARVRLRKSARLQLVDVIPLSITERALLKEIVVSTVEKPLLAWLSLAELSNAI